MKFSIYSVIIVLLLFSCTARSPQYDGLVIEKKKVDENNVIYKVGTTTLYSYKITKKNGESFQIFKSDQDSLTSIINREGKFTKIKMSVVNAKKSEKTNKNQTEIIYNLEPDPISRTFTGIVENAENIWLHPPRIGYLKVLETCPFPYIKLNKPAGFKWTDAMSIGDQWSNKFSGIWKDKLLLNYTYEIIGKESVDTNLGNLECEKIVSKAKSKIGESELVTYFNPKYGFVKLDYKLFDGTVINLNLLQID